MASKSSFGISPLDGAHHRLKFTARAQISKSFITHIPRLEKDDTLASHLTRLECAYVDFHEKSQSWRLGPVIDKQKLEMLIENVDRVLNVARKS